MSTETLEKTETGIVANIPNAAKLIASLRHLDYDNLTALSDLVDNSIDAGAKHINVTIEGGSTINPTSDISRIIVSDDGCGMTTRTLHEALKLGSDAPKNADQDLGYYGMGLVTASIAMGTRLEVITKHATEETFLASVQDLDEIVRTNKFIKTLGVASKSQLRLIQPYIHDEAYSGTVVIIDRMDNCQHATVKALQDKLIAHFGRVYRKFLQANKIKLFVNKHKVEAKDPIYDFEPTILHEEDVVLKNGTIHIKVAQLKDYGAPINRVNGIGMATQGFYVLRNDREILAGDALGIITKRSQLNLLRIELSFPGTLDKVLSSNFSKSRIILNHDLHNKIGKIVFPYVKAVSYHAEQAQRGKATKGDFNTIEKFISQKAHLLKLPLSDKEKRNPKTKCGTIKPTGKHDARINLEKKTTTKKPAIKVKFTRVRLGDKGPLYTSSKEKDVVVINWNEEHPFYIHCIEKNFSKPEIVNPLCFLIYSFASAELVAAPSSETLELLENIRYDVGRNLAVLMKG